jgi:hypothetical protein
MEWTALENQVLQNQCELMEMCFQDSLKKPCRMLTSFAVLSPRFQCDRSLKSPLKRRKHKKWQLWISKMKIDIFYTLSTRPVFHRHSTNILQHATASRW